MAIAIDINNNAYGLKYLIYFIIICFCNFLDTPTLHNTLYSPMTEQFIQYKLLLDLFIMHSLVIDHTLYMTFKIIKIMFNFFLMSYY